jgi:hypothetical protein
MERRTVSFHPAQGYVDVRVFGIEMRYSNPLQSCVQVFLHFPHQIAGQSVQVDPFAEFRRDDHFPEPCVACFLPAIKDLRRRNDFALVAKSAGLRGLSLHCRGQCSDRVRATARWSCLASTLREPRIVGCTAADRYQMHYENGACAGAESLWRSAQPSSYRETRETLRFRGAYGDAGAECGTPARPQFS